MSTPLAYLNGRLIPAAEAAVAVHDAGFVLGATVAEQVRTFSGRLFRLDEHLARLARSLEIVGIDPGMSMSELEEAATDLAARNHALLAEGDDLGLSVFVTPGPYATMACSADAAGRARATVGMHTYPLPFHLWTHWYRRGQPLVVTDVQQVPSACWPAELKCRSRMHYYLADQRARRADPGARALLLDEAGHVLEASTANLVIYRGDEGIVSPPREAILPGVSVRVLAELAATLDIPFGCRWLFLDDVLQADEVILCSTSPCLWPVTSIDGRPIADGTPGALFARLLTAWSALVGVDIQSQAERFASR